MDRNEYNFKTEEMRIAVRNKDYDRAVEIADSLDYKREKANDVLSLIADAYELTHQYDKAKEALIIAYENTNVGRQLAYRLCLLSVKLKQFDEAEEFYQDFIELAPRDNDKFILQYKMKKAQNVPIEQLIEILEEYMKDGMEERWAYELAKLYHMAGDEESCIDMCDEISLWFAEGTYVNKAMELKKIYRPLTKTQQERYDNWKAGKSSLPKTDEKEKQSTESDDSSEEGRVSVKISDKTAHEQSIPFMIKKDSLKESIRKLKHVNDESEKEDEEDEFTGHIKSQDDDMKIADELTGEIDLESIGEIKKELGNTRMFNPNDVSRAVAADTKNIAADIMSKDIEVKPITSDGFDTMDIQAVVARGMEEILEEDKKKEPEMETPETVGMTLDNIYKLEGDGQIGLNATDIQPETPEKQITGQLSIEEVLKKLQSRGILKADTVNEAVKTLDEGALAAAKEAAKEAAEFERPTHDKELGSDNEKELDMVKKGLESFAAEAAADVFIPTVDTDVIEEEIKFQTGEISFGTMDLNEIVNKGSIAERNLSDTDKVEADNHKEEEMSKIEELPKIEEEASSSPTVIIPEITSELADLNSQPETEEKEMEMEKSGEEEIVKAADENTSVPILDLSFDMPEIVSGQEENKEQAEIEEPEEIEETEKQETESMEKREIEKTQELKDIQKTDDSLENKTDELELDLEEIFSNEIIDFREMPAEEIEIAKSESDGNEQESSNSDEETEDLQVETEDDVVEVEDEVSEETLIPETEEEELEVEEDLEEDDTKEEKSEVELEEEEAKEIDDLEEMIVGNKSEEASEDLAEPENSEETKETESLEVPKEPDSIQETESLDTLEEADTQESESLEETKKSEVKQHKAEEKIDAHSESSQKDKDIVTEADMKVFENYTNIEGLDDAIKSTIINLVQDFVPRGNSVDGNVVIIGDEKSGKTSLAIDLIKLVNAKRGRTGRRIAKVSAEVLNRRGFAAALNKIAGSDLIVEGAPKLEQKVIDEIKQATRLFTDDMIIVFEGEPKAMDDMFKNNSELKQIFDNKIAIKTYDVKEWVNCGIEYAESQGYSIDELGMLALFKSIDDWYGIKKEINQNDVEEIMNLAIKKSKRKIGRKIVEVFRHKDENELKVLRESDFNIK